MQIGISGQFHFSEIFGGTLNETTNCRLELLGGYSLIYAEVENLDILQALNQAFDLKLGDRSLTVASAGFFTYSRDDGQPSTKPLATQFPHSPVPTTIATTATPVTDTTSFWLSVDLSGPNGDQGLFGSLVDMRVAPDTRLSLAATFAKGAQAGTAIKTATYAAWLDGAITLFDAFSISNASVTYSVGTASRLWVAADIAVTLFGSHFTFSGSVLSDSGTQSVTADIQAMGAADLSSLFGGSFPNIEFTGVRFNLYYPYGKNTEAAKFMVRGGCVFGGLGFVGLLYVERTTPVLGSVVFTSPASISTLFDQCIKDASWPSDLVDLTLKADSQAYYNGTAAPLTLTLATDAEGPTLLPVPAGPVPGASPPVVVTYQPGFNLSAGFTLSLLDTVHVEGMVVVNTDGVTATIDLGDPIDLYVLRITRLTDATKGPALSIATKGHAGTMGFAGFLWFFGQEFGASATLGKATDGGVQVEATLVAPKGYPPVLPAGQQLTVRYSRAHGFQVPDWPAFQAVEGLVDFFDQLKKLTSGGTCGQITNFVCTNLLRQTWSISPSFASGANGLALTMTVACTLRFMGLQQADIATITLPNALSIPIPNSINLDPDSPDYLWKVIVDAIGGAAESFVQALLDNGDATAEFLVLFGGQAALNYAATLICQGATSAGVGGATSAGVAAAGEALGTAAALAGAIATAVAASNGGHGGGSGGGGGGGSAPDAPGDVTAQIDGGQVTAVWQPSSGAQGYTATLTGPAGRMAGGNADYGSYSYSFGSVSPPAPLPATATIAVTASNPIGTSPAASTTIRFLAAPTGVTARPAAVPAPGVGLQLDWTGAAGDAAYTVMLTGGATRNLQSPTTNALLTFGPSDPAGAYAVAVVATGGATDVPSAASPPLALTRLAMPNGITSRPAPASTGEAAIALGWTAVNGATEYVVTLAGGKSTVLDSATTSVTLPFAPADPVGGYTVTVAATGGTATIASAASPPLSLTRLGVPTDLAASATATAIEASWTAVASAGSYRFAWIDPAGTPGSRSVPAGTPPTVRATIALPAPTVAGVWAITVQAVPADAPGGFVAGPPSAPQHVTVTAASTPEEMAADCRRGGVGGAACGTALIGAFPTLTPDALALAMAQGGYPADETGAGLHAAFPAITLAAMAAALVYAYPPAPTTPEQLAATCFAHGTSGSDCGRQLIASFDDLTANPLAWAMAQGDYPAGDTAAGLHAAFPAITPAQMATALAYAYPATPAQLAHACFASGDNGVDCGRRLIHAFPDLTADPLAAAMAQGGYAAEATASGLVVAFPSITPSQMAVALARAYP